MANRPVFIAKKEYPFYEIVDVEFEFYNGVAVSQKQKSIKSLHNAFLEINSSKQLLEVSSKADDSNGVMLSAFNMKVSMGDKAISLESSFQGSKKFVNGGPYTDVYELQPWEAKKDKRLKESGELIKFVFGGKEFCNEPKDFFYNWIYIKALREMSEYKSILERYDAFTDIEFNPKKSINCQAKAMAIACGLYSAGLLDECLKSEHFFYRVYITKSTLKNLNSWICFR